MIAEKGPLVMCLTNTVAANFTANCLLAVGAKPAMIEEPEEAAELASVANAVLVNVGTVTARQADVMRAAIASCNAHGVPWALDPVAADKIGFRRRLVLEFLAQKPALVRGTRDEIDFLLKAVPGLKGSIPLLATAAVDELWPTGAADAPQRIAGGVARLQSVTATGCAQGALCAAFLGAGAAPDEALLQASRLMKRAGERAWEMAKTPGSFQVALVDALYALTHHD